MSEPPLQPTLRSLSGRFFAQGTVSLRVIAVLLLCVTVSCGNGENASNQQSSDTSVAAEPPNDSGNSTGSQSADATGGVIGSKCDKPGDKQTVNGIDLMCDRVDGKDLVWMKDKYASGGGNDQGKSNGGDSGTPQPLQLTQMPYDVTSLPTTWSSLNLDNWPANRFEPVHIFGKDYDGNGKFEVTLMFDFLPVGGEVRAPFDGQVLEVRDQAESCDSELYLLPANEDPNHPSVSLDHVIPLDTMRTPGAKFKAGDVIATLGKWECKEDFARFELMILAQTEQGLMAECSLRLLAQPQASTVDAQLKEMMQAWNALNPRTPYPTEVLENGICNVPFMPLK